MTGVQTCALPIFIDEVKSVQIFINEKSFKTKYFDIYSGLSVEEKKLLKLRNRIEKLENSNRKRRNSIARLEKKYSLQEMPDEARMTLENTKNNLIKGEESLEKYRQQLYEMESMENKQLSLW